MGRKLTPLESELSQRVDEVLHYVWDPIGVARVPEARDEYSGYALRALGMLLESANTQQLVAFLLEIEGARTGLAPNTEHAQHVAELLLRWKSVLAAKYDRLL
jgi:hypothetical protein